MTNFILASTINAAKANLSSRGFIECDKGVNTYRDCHSKQVVILHMGLQIKRCRNGVIYVTECGTKYPGYDGLLRLALHHGFTIKPVKEM